MCYAPGNPERPEDWERRGLQAERGGPRLYMPPRLRWSASVRAKAAVGGLNAVGAGKVSRISDSVASSTNPASRGQSLQCSDDGRELPSP